MMSGQKKAENILYVVVWVVLFAGPLLSMSVENLTSDASHMEWHDTFDTWRILLGFCVTFAIHNFLLAPLLVYSDRRKKYFFFTVMLVAGICVYQQVWTARHSPQHEGSTPPPELREKRTPPTREGRAMRPMPARDDFRPKPRKERHTFPVEKQFMMLVIILLLLGMNIGTKYFFKTLDDRKRMKELERQNLRQQLQYLKYQINPHFFMNTLNNIHALVDIDPEEAKYTIEELSKLMRYVLYDSNKPLAPLRKELEFVKHYIGLMKIRYTDHVRITVQLPEDVPEGAVPPLLFITFVENAFKHGISYDRPSFVEVCVNIADGRVLMTCRNSLPPKRNEEKKKGGVGMENAVKRLKLIYKDDYRLNVKTEENTYSVTMQLPIRLDESKLRNTND